MCPSVSSRSRRPAALASPQTKQEWVCGNSRIAGNVTGRPKQSSEFLCEDPRGCPINFVLEILRGDE
jgi:hypothetical protein